MSRAYSILYDRAAEGKAARDLDLFDCKGDSCARLFQAMRFVGDDDSIVSIGGKNPQH